MGNYRKKWWEENDLEEVPRRGYSSDENRAFYRGRMYERRRLFRIVLWCVAGLIITLVAVGFLDRHVISFVPIR